MELLDAKKLNKKDSHFWLSFGAENETRTRDPDLGKVVLRPPKGFAFRLLPTELLYFTRSLWYVKMLFFELGNTLCVTFMLKLSAVNN